MVDPFSGIDETTCAILIEVETHPRSVPWQCNNYLGCIQRTQGAPLSYCDIRPCVSTKLVVHRAVLVLCLTPVNGFSSSGILLQHLLPRVYNRYIGTFIGEVLRLGVMECSVHLTCEPGIELGSRGGRAGVSLQTGASAQEPAIRCDSSKHPLQKVLR